MNTSENNDSLILERGQTDTSLVTERGKTDDSFADHRKQTELETDRRVKSSRESADKARARNREQTDSKNAADQFLKSQRATDDAAMVSERSMMDEALVQERELNDFESAKFLERERKETDRNLKRERTHTDSQAFNTSKLLIKEMLSHKVTKSALTSRDEFLAIVSHDLRNPIGAILSFAELLLEKYPRDAGETGSWIEVIKRNADTSLKLINDILDMERFAEGKLQLAFALSDITSLIYESIEMFQNVASDREVTLRATPLTANVPVSCDRDRIAQVLTNLIGNAIKFSPAGGTVTISTELIENDFCVSVVDMGPGIPADKKESIFERYAQLGNKDRHGLGLGLHIAAMLIEAHRGKIGVVSTVGRGSNFCFSIPMNPSPEH